MVVIKGRRQSCVVSSINLMKYIIIFLACLFFQTSNAIAGSYPDELTFCFGNFKPFEYSDGNEVKGMNVEILEAVARSLEITINWKVYPWARCQYLAKTGDVDGLMSLYRTAEREKYYYFPDENINIDECVFFTYPGSNVHYDGTLKSLSGMKILTAHANSYGDAFDEATNFEKVVAPNTVNVVRMVAGKRYRMGIGSRKAVESEKKLNAYKDKLIILDPPYCIKTYFAFSKDRGSSYKALAADFSNALKAFKQTAQYKRIMDKYESGALNLQPRAVKP